MSVTEWSRGTVLNTYPEVKRSGLQCNRRSDFITSLSFTAHGRSSDNQHRPWNWTVKLRVALTSLRRWHCSDSACKQRKNKTGIQILDNSFSDPPWHRSPVKCELQIHRGLLSCVRAHVPPLAQVTLHTRSENSNQKRIKSQQHRPIIYKSRHPSISDQHPWF